MSDVEVGTFAREASPRVEAVGRRLIDCGLGRDDSLLTPGEPVWSVDNLEQLKREYVDKPDMGPGDFFDKLKHQLAETSPQQLNYSLKCLSSMCCQFSTWVAR